jgi:hypothetical protein
VRGVQTCVQDDRWFPWKLRDVDVSPAQTIGSWSRLSVDAGVRLL